MELAIDQPGGTAIQVYRCGHCGDLRACRPGWHTCCHVCLDERTDGGRVPNLSALTTASTLWGGVTNDRVGGSSSTAAAVSAVIVTGVRMLLFSA